MNALEADPATPELHAFIRSCVERAGGLIEDRGRGRLAALLPPELQAVAGGRPLVSLALEPEGGEDALPATLGSPFVDALVQLATAHGTAACGHLPAGHLKRKGLREEAERTLRFSNCRTRYLDADADVRRAAIAQFDFKVAFLSEERRERCFTLTVNLDSGVADPALATRLPGLAVAEEDDGVFPDEPAMTLEAAYETARRAVRELILDEARRQQVRVARRFAVEAARIAGYYDQAIHEIERRRERERRRSAAEDGGAPARGEAAEGHAARAEALAQKVEATGLERERKLRELGETYRIRAHARLASARYLWQPKVYFKVLLDRGPVTRSLTLAYDGLLERLELPACESCRRPTARLRASSTAKLLCPACAGEGPGARAG